MQKVKRLTCGFALAAFVILSAVTLGAAAAAETGAAETEMMESDAVFEGLDRNTYVTVSEFETLTGRTMAQYGEAPMLAAMVAAGTLPPVEQRLPDEPLVVLPLSEVKRIGTYGGILRMSTGTGYQEPAQTTQSRFLSAEYEYSQNVFPHLAQSWEMKDGGATWVLHMRKGLKWSDGTPWSTDDIMFFYEDLMQNKEFQPTPAGYMFIASGGRPIVMERIDELTWQLVADAPFHLKENTEGLLARSPLHPKHYLEAFHPKYQDKATLDRMVNEGGFTSWTELMWFQIDMFNQSRQVDKPVLTPWKVVQPLPAKTVIYERNPYFHHVDVAGNQLPYMDRVHMEQTADREVDKLRALAGEDDFYATQRLEVFPLVKAAEQEGTLKVVRWPHSQMNTADIEFNMTSSDPVLRQIFQNRDFRFGVSHALNREAMNELLYNGMLEPQQVCESVRSPYHNERLCKTAIEFDQAKANRLLDAAGLDKRDADGWRMRPDGARLELNMITFVPWKLDQHGEMVVDDLKNVGLFTTLRTIEWGHGQELRSANEIDVFLMGYTWWGNEGAPAASDQLGIPSPVSFWSHLWKEWLYSNGEKGERPPPELMKSWNAFGVLQSTYDEEERKRQWKIITDNAADQLWVIGTLSAGGYVITHVPELRNVPTDFRMHNRGQSGRFWIWFKE